VRLDGAAVHAPTDCDGAPSPAGPGARTGPTTQTAPPGTDESGTGSPSAPAAAGGSRSSRGTGGDSGTGSDSGTSTRTGTGTGRDTDGVPARGTGGGGTGDGHASAGAGAGSAAVSTGGGSGGGPTRDGATPARTADAPDGRTSAPSGTGVRAGEHRDGGRFDGQDRRDPGVAPAAPGEAPVITVPGLGADDDGPAGRDSDIGRRVLGVLAHLPRRDGGAGGGTGSGLV
jgi:hypothetical protein